MYLKCHYLLSCIFVPNFAIDGAKLLKMLVCDSINIDTSVKKKLLLFAFIQMYMQYIESTTLSQPVISTNISVQALPVYRTVSI